MNITFKILLNKRKGSKNQQYPLILRVYKGGSSKEHSLNIKMPESDWDEVKQLVLPSNPNHQVFNAKIVLDRSKIQKLILLSEGTDVSPTDIIAALSPEKLKPITKDKSYSIIKYGEAIIKSLTDTGKVGNAFVYSCAINKLKSFAKTDNFPFEALTYKKLVEFQDSMLADEIKVNTISVYMRTIRAVFNKAIKEGIVPVTAYPFTAYRIKNEKTLNRVLTLNEIKSIATCSLPVDTPIWHWRNFFLLSFNLIGINFSDLLTLKGKDVVNGRIVFRRRKTGKIYTIKLQGKTIELLSYYADLNNLNKDELLFPILKQTKDPMKLKKDLWQAIKTCNEYLERIAEKLGISKGITTYYSRYTWANIARSLGYSKDIIGQALGHSYGNATTSIYLDDYDNEIIDAANEKVITTVFK